MKCVGFGLSGNFKTLKWVVLEGPIFSTFWYYDYMLDESLQCSK